MQIQISGHHVEITQALREYILDKFKKLERHSDHLNSTQVILTVEGLVHLAEATLRLNGAELFAKSESNDMYAAIDLLVDKLDRQINSHKGKLKDRKQHAR